MSKALVEAYAMLAQNAGMGGAPTQKAQSALASALLQSQYNQMATAPLTAAADAYVYARSAYQALDPNQDPGYALSVSAVETLWRTRWGDGWVRQSDIPRDEPQWSTFLTRLHKLGRLETAVGSDWVRIIT